MKALEVSSLQRGLTRSLHLRCGSSFEDGVSDQRFYSYACTS